MDNQMEKKGELHGNWGSLGHVMVRGALYALRGGWLVLVPCVDLYMICTLPSASASY